LFRILTLALFALLLVACSQDVTDARQLLTQSLAVPKDVEFRRLDTYPGGVVCGEFSAYISHHLPKQDYQRFLTVRGELYAQPSELEWSVYCSDEPGQRLFEATGIGPYTADNGALAKIAADLSSLALALDSYYSDNFKYPTAAQTLQALVSARQDDQGREPRKFREGGYLEKIPNDPWGRPYEYQEEQWGRTKGNYVLTTRGADGSPGGEGADKDISTIYLQYLEHIAITLAP